MMSKFSGFRNFRKFTSFMIALIMVVSICVSDKTAFDSEAAGVTGVEYSAHIQSLGWSAYATDGRAVGTVRQAKRLEAIKIRLKNQEYTGDITYRTHVEGYGWLPWVKNNVVSGTEGQARRIEAIQIKLAGKIAEYYDIYYRAHIQHYGWTGWAKNGTSCGSMGLALRMEAIEIKLVKKNDTAPGSDKYHFYNGSSNITYRVHVQSTGWMNYVNEGKGAGTIGYDLRVEAFDIKFTGNEYTGSVSYEAHVGKVGWQSWVSNGATAGTVGQSKSIEAIAIKLEGEVSQHYDIYYRVYVNGQGWQAWKVNGQTAGTTGQSLMIEAMQVIMVEKGEKPSYPESDIVPKPEPKPEPEPEPEPEPVYSRIDPSKPMVALTFDDGPSTAVTGRILDALEKVDGRATFFVVGNRVASNASVMKRASDMGCQIANHTWDHPQLTKLSTSSIQSQIKSTQDAIYNVTGKYPTMVRPPYGSTSKTVLNTIDMPLILWSIDTRDWESRNANSVYNEVIGKVRDGDIILMHDIYNSTATAAERIIPELVREGYQLVTVEELAYYRGYTPSAHNKYSSFR